MENLVRPLILSGGSGSRLWPLSRQAYPKQFLPLVDEQSLFQKTCQRVGDPLFLNPTILSNDAHRFIAAEQMQQIGVKADAIVLEPLGRNTAPAVLVAALQAAKEQDDQLLLLLPSDHLIEDEAQFIQSISDGIVDAKAGQLVIFGVEPTSPHTGYGYIKTKGEKTGNSWVVERFVEKPNLEKAQAYLDEGGYYWNAGIFLFSARTMIQAFETHMPELVSLCRQALEGAKTDLDFIRLERQAYAQCESISLDYAIMEKSSNISCVPMQSNWSDLGSWAAVAHLSAGDEDGNAAKGDVQFHNSRNCYAHSDDGASIALNGLENIVAVATKDAILISAKDKTEDVKQIVDQLSGNNAGKVTHHSRVYRPWGWYENLELGERFQVKCLMVKPGGILSLQRHKHRSEHWVVVNGSAKVTIGERVQTLQENQSVYIPVGEMHRLENPGDTPTLLVEVQTGSYLGEDDIERFEDIYGRGKDDDLP